MRDTQPPLQTFLVHFYLYTSLRLSTFKIRIVTASSSILAMTRYLPMRYFQKSPNFDPDKGAPKLRGFSEGASRSVRNFKILWATGLSNFSSSRLAAGSNSIFLAKVFQNFFKRNGLRATRMNIG